MFTGLIFLICLYLVGNVCRIVKNYLTIDQRLGGWMDEQMKDQRENKQNARQVRLGF